MSQETKTLTPELRAFIEEWKPRPGNLIMVLHKIQQTYGYCKNCFHELLNEHNAEKNEVYTRAACRQCYEWFVITKGEAEFFQAKGMNLPSRCPSCRGRK